MSYTRTVYTAADGRAGQISRTVLILLVLACVLLLLLLLLYRRAQVRPDRASFPYVTQLRRRPSRVQVTEYTTTIPRPLFAIIYRA